MQLSYKCKLHELEDRRIQLLSEKKIQLDDLSTRRTQVQTQCTLKREITDLLDRREIINFLLKAEPFLRKYEVLQQLPQAASFISRRELHQEFLVLFGMEDVIPEELQVRRKHEVLEMQRVEMAEEDHSCTACGKTNIELIRNQECVIVCPYCGYSKRDAICDDVDGLPYEDKRRIGSPPYTYKPEQHFTDLLNQVQGNTRRPIPAELFMQLRLECRKRSILQESVTPQMVRKILREIRRTEYYDEICAIAHSLNPSYMLVRISDEDQALLRALFREVYAHFHAAKSRINPSRKNFMSYPHLARVLCDLMGFSSYTKEFTSLKNREKRRNHDRLLKEIFGMLGWPFRNTV